MVIYLMIIYSMYSALILSESIKLNEKLLQVIIFTGDMPIVYSTNPTIEPVTKKIKGIEIITEQYMWLSYDVFSFYIREMHVHGW
jgi:sulfur relay (sulfurtransferase) DsrC/TusE family protein